jgi:hypothetical protein
MPASIVRRSLAVTSAPGGGAVYGEIGGLELPPGHALAKLPGLDCHWKDGVHDHGWGDPDQDLFGVLDLPVRAFRVGLEPLAGAPLDVRLVALHLAGRRLSDRRGQQRTGGGRGGGTARRLSALKRERRRPALRR